MSAFVSVSVVGIEGVGISQNVSCGNASSLRHCATVAVPSNRSTLRMAEGDSEEVSSSSSNPVRKGFGKVQPKKEKTKAQIEREQAGSRYDKMQQSGMPEYNIWIKVKGADEKSWFPVGSLCVDRSSKVNEAIFQNEDALLKGAFRLFPKLAKESEFEYGFQLKEFPDEPVRPAEKPSETSNAIKDFFDKILSPLNLDDKK